MPDLCYRSQSHSQRCHNFEQQVKHQSSKSTVMMVVVGDDELNILFSTKTNIERAPQAKFLSCNARNSKNCFQNRWISIQNHQKFPAAYRRPNHIPPYQPYTPPRATIYPLLGEPYTPLKSAKTTIYPPNHIPPPKSQKQPYTPPPGGVYGLYNIKCNTDPFAEMLMWIPEVA